MKLNQSKIFLLCLLSAACAAPAPASTISDVSAAASLPPLIGLNYYVYPNNLDYSTENPGFDATSFIGPDYQYQGVVSNISDLHSINYPNAPYYCILPNSTVSNTTIPCDQITVVMQGFFYAASAGTYKFSTDNNTIDNGFYVWTGQNAEGTNYNNGNRDYAVERVGNPPHAVSRSQTYSLIQGQYFPVTFMWVNGGFSARTSFIVTDPNGHNTTDTTGLFTPTPFYP